MAARLPVEDRELVLRGLQPFADELRGTDIFVTGGTGFIGKWLLTAFRWANEEFGLGSRVTVLCRDPGRFHDEWPELASGPGVLFVAGDVRNLPHSGCEYDFVIHAAGVPNGPAYRNPDEFIVLTNGTRRVMEFAERCGARRVLLVSSGAARLDPPTLYGEGKRCAELIAAASEVPAVVVRGYSFLGPFLPLDAGYAASHFLRAALGGRAIEVNNPAAVRGYLYAGELGQWLLTAMLRGRPRQIYDCGSDSPVTMAEFAALVAAQSDTPLSLVFPETDAALPADHYVPDLSIVSAELGLRPTVILNEAIRRTLRWFRR